MSKKRNHPEFPDRETLIEYLKGALSPEERHRIEKLMLEHEFLREVVEGLESVDPEDLEEDLAELSLSVRQRSGLYRNTGFNLYKLAATVSLIILASAILFVVFDRMNQNRQNNDLSMNQQAHTEMDESRVLTEDDKMKGKDIEETSSAETDKKTQERTIAMPPERTVEEPSGEKMSGEDDLAADNQTTEPDPKKYALEDDQEIAVADGKQNLNEVPEVETILEAEENAPYERQTSARKSALPEVVSSPVADETISGDKMQQGRYSGLSVPYMTAANLPHPVHGYETYMQYLTDSLRYPETALNERIEGQVIVTFTVGADSIPRGLSVINPLGYGCDQEAIRLIREGPAWIPAVTGGKVVESEMKLPIRFTLPGNQDK